MAENAELYKDAAFVKRLEAFDESLKAADRAGLFIQTPSRSDPFSGSSTVNRYFRELERTTGKYPPIIDTSKRNRAERALIMQAGPEFVPSIVNWYDQNYLKGNLDPSPALLEIYNKEGALRKPASTGTGSGTNAHHQIPVSTADRLKKLPIQKQLQIVSQSRANEWPVGTVAEEMMMLSGWSHQQDPKGVTAHSDPLLLIPGVNSAVNQGAWKFDPLPASISVSEAVDRLADETYRPQALMNSLAFNRKDETQAREILNRIAGGDLWTKDMAERARLAKNLQAARNSGTTIDMNHYVRNPEILGPVSDVTANSLKIDPGLTKGLKAFGAVAGALPLFDATDAVAGTLGAANTKRSSGDRLASGLQAVSGATGLASFNPAIAAVTAPISLATGLLSAAVQRRSDMDKPAAPRAAYAGPTPRLIPTVQRQSKPIGKGQGGVSKPVGAKPTSTGFDLVNEAQYRWGQFNRAVSRMTRPQGQV